ncbi:protein CREG1 [Periophthalmus magnuspinnatus]|uniref:CREG-like beta-barrel domain-containing protein n=1 Tax=Periophthalmus magnuspinnatus TaxID=409849 RepID=A0A3B3ZN54_9GOBI|nr:protein CREG1 [Periophthalmus magnuspinnatus]
MSAPVRPRLALVLGVLCCFPRSWVSCVPACRVHIPPHDQVARVARFVTHLCDWASLATVATRAPVEGQPFSNVFSISDGPELQSSGVPYLYLTPMEISVQDLQVSPVSSLSMSLAQTDFCRDSGYDPQSPLCAHVILSGSVLQINGSEADFAKKALFSRHPEMMDWPHDHGWFFAKFNITLVWVLDYFGGVKTVSPEEYFQASPEYNRKYWPSTGSTGPQQEVRVLNRKYRP